MPLKEDTD